MLKYYVALFLIAGGVLMYVFLQDPCNNQVRDEFLSQNPGYEIVSTAATEGSPDKVHCHVYYLKPGNDRVFEDVRLYQNSSTGWRFTRVLESGEAKPAS